MLKYKIDIYPLLFVLLLSVVQFALYFSSIEPLLLFSIVMFLGIANGIGIAIAHNHYHNNIFKNRWLNRILEYLMLLQTGAVPYAWTLHHNKGHHKHFTDLSKEPAPWKRPDGTIMTRWEFTIKNTFKIFPECFKIAKKHPVIKKRFIIACFMSFIILAGLIAYNPINGLIVFLLPMILMLFNLIDNTYLHHVELETKDLTKASRNNLNKTMNFITLNLGYHAAHHINPSLHWSKLPELHDSIKDQIPDDLISHTFHWRA